MNWAASFDDLERGEAFVARYGQKPIRAIDDAVVAEWLRGGKRNGTVPTLRGLEKPGCSFAPRCSLAKPMHFENTPALKEVRPGHKVACFLY